MKAESKARDVVGCQLVSEILHLFGRAKVRVTGSSMLPHILPGDILVVRRQGLEQLAEGDIALFAREGRLFAHRVVDAKREGTPYLVTAGDSLLENDPPVSTRELLGRVTHVFRGESRIITPRRTVVSRLISATFRHSEFLKRCLLCLLNRTRCFREGVECRI